MFFHNKTYISINIILTFLIICIRSFFYDFSYVSYVYISFFKLIKIHEEIDIQQVVFLCIFVHHIILLNIIIKK